MSFIEPTYEDYLKATNFARFKYKYGIVVMVLSWLALLFICYYMVVNGEAIASNPLIYGAKKYGVTCVCSISGNSNLIYVNGSNIWGNINLEGEVNLTKWDKER